MIYRRHLKSCSHGLLGRHDVDINKCNCPLWIDVRKNGIRIHESMNLVDVEKAREREKSWTQGAKKLFYAGIRSQEKVEAGPIPISEAWQKFLGQAKARKLSPTSIYKYDLLRRRMEDFAKRNGYFLLRELNTDVLEDFQSEWNEGDVPLSDVTLSKTLERLKSFWRAAFLRKWIDENPALTLRGPKPKPRPTLPFTQEEMTRILAATENYRDKARKTGQDNALRLRAFVLVLRYTGMRLGDVATLTTERVVGNKIQLYTQKTGVPVYCVLPQFVADLLVCLPRISDKYFFWTGNSTPHTVNGIFQRTLKSLFILAKIKHGYAHRFRDTFSVSLLLAGVPIEQVSILLGHSNIKVTQQHYNPWVRDRQLQLEADLQRAWNGDPIVLLNSKVEPGARLGIDLPN
jgi:integrase/recombinase XerD